MISASSLLKRASKHVQRTFQATCLLLILSGIYVVLRLALLLSSLGVFFTRTYQSRLLTFLLSTAKQCRTSILRHIEAASRVAIYLTGPVQAGMVIIEEIIWFLFNTNMALSFAKISSACQEFVERAVGRALKIALSVIQSLVGVLLTSSVLLFVNEIDIWFGVGLFGFLLWLFVYTRNSVVDGLQELQGNLGLPHSSDQKSKLRKNARVYAGSNLGLQQVRLLMLMPGQFNDPIEAILDVGSWETSNYEALSYSWGNADLRNTMKVNGQSFLVGKSLYVALRYLRSQGRVRTLWIDAICINQIDDEERSEQVRQMTQIYQSAERVIVWLGIAPLGLRQAFECAGTRVPQTFGYYRAISSVLCAAWWERIWVVQELVVARMVTVQCSEYTMSWELFCWLIDDFVIQHQISKDLPGLKEYKTLRSLRNHRLQRTPPKFDLLGLAYDFRTRKAKDPRDKLFALQGLLETNKADLITPDYSKETDVVFQKFARNCINRFRNLSILTISECEPEAKPTSWCPYWTGSRLSDHFSRRLFWNGDLTERREVWQRDFSAAGNYPAPICTAYSDELIKVQGFGDDIVIDTGPYSGLNLGYLWYFTYYLSRPILPAVVTWIRSRFDWKILLPHWTMLAEDAIRKHDSSVTWEDFHLTITAGVFNAHPNGPDEKSYLEVRDVICEGRNLFVTGKGVFGLGPANVQVGDRVCVLLGSTVPMILRSTTRNWEYIGQAYVNDIMEYRGDIARDIAEGKLVLEDFYLC